MRKLNGLAAKRLGLLNDTKDEMTWLKDKLADESNARHMAELSGSSTRDISPWEGSWIG